ncbi:MAG: DUF1800 family protein [Roseibacillus sp.]
MKIPLSALVFAGISSAAASIETVFVVGENDGQHLPFGAENSITEPPPGSTTQIDDHYYVSLGEPAANFERALTTWDPSNTVHFDLTAAQTNTNGVFNFTINFLWSGNSQDTTTANVVSFRLNGVEFFLTPSFEAYEEFNIEFATLPGMVQTGANTLEIRRTGGTNDTWLGIDSLQLTVDPTANQDEDSDGLPLRWETLYQLSDNDGSDAGISSDEDLLTNLQEFQAGTNPRSADSDSDGLPDHLETATDPLDPDSDHDGLLDGEETTSSPVLADTDSDGAPDAWEIRTGYDPSNNASAPPSFSGAIGVNFRSGVDSGEKGLWTAITPNGWIPQINWNQTQPLREWGVPDETALLTGDTTDIEQPVAETIVDSSGSPLATTITFSYDGCWTSANSGTAAAELLHGFLRSDPTFNASVSVADIPYSNYDLYLYLGAEYVAPSVTLRLNGDPSNEQTLRVQATAPTKNFRPAYQVAGPLLPRYNTVRFADLTGSNLSLELIHGSDITGIAGIQIVDTNADSDSDLLPDYWELQHRTDAGTSNANADPDGDLLDNAAEFALGTDPNNPDSDNDGLSDLVETNTGTFIDSSNTGTNPLYGDTDGDGLGDNDELQNAFPSNPLLSDTDNDGQNDAVEIDKKSDPSSAGENQVPVPTFPAPNSFSWEVNNVQIEQNHDTPVNTSGAGSQRDFLSLNVSNALAPIYRGLDFRIAQSGNEIGYTFVSRGTALFQHSDNYDLYHSDFSNDLRASFGLSGYGSHDISDPLTFQVLASPNPAPSTSWSLTFNIINQKSSIVVATHTFSNTTPSASIAAQTATWVDQNETPDQASLITGIGITAYRSSTALESLPAFAPYLDSDNDGISDAWEVLHSLDPNDASDALLDSDNDDLTNRDEYLRGTLPSNPDSDNDGANDGEELAQWSDPSDPTSEPPYFHNPPVYEPDLDNNGLPDVWEAAFQTSGLNASDDNDGDGFSNYQEAVAGTDPLDVTSMPFFEVSPAPTDGILRASWPVIPGKDQTLQSSPNLSDWNLVAGAATTADDTSTQDVAAALNQQFFQVGISDRNSDGDPLNDWTELALGLSPTSAHSVSRPVAIDTTSDGEGDSEISGDLAYWQSTFGNLTELSSGGSVNTPSRYDASRLLLQSTFGPTLEEIDDVRALGLEGWIDDQITAQPPTRHRDYIDEIYRDFDGPRTNIDYSYNDLDDFLNDNNVNTSFARAAISGPDQLRQRVAFALSQIIVVSRRDANLNNRLIAVTDFYDLFVEHAFGNYQDLLMEVTLHPTMGRYLSHIGNRPPAPEINRYPDENYARELMQLFTIGIWELEQDGSRKTDTSGAFIPTYSNAEITDLARVMTGLWFGDNLWGAGGWQDFDYAVPMDMHPNYHDFEPKTLLGGFTIPKRTPSKENALLDVQDAIRNLFEHPNCAPFISKALIQFLVTSNPTPAYVGRISSVFADDGTGERGNLAATIKAILMDPEARDPTIANRPEFGIFREPVIRTMHLARLTNVNRDNNVLWWDYGDYYAQSLQQATSSPSVFNFFRPDYRAPGILTENNLVAPALEITNSHTAVAFPDELWGHANFGFALYTDYSFPADYSQLLPYANEHEALLDYVNLVVCGGNISAQTRSIILNALNTTDPGDDSGRVRLALYLAFMCPQGAVQR